MCYEVGYTNLSNFNRSFLRHVRRAAPPTGGLHGKRVSTDSQ
ncbi:hypothetical protein ACQZ42_32335 [Rhizobium rhizogenes]